MKQFSDFSCISKFSIVRAWFAIFIENFSHWFIVFRRPIFIKNYLPRFLNPLLCISSQLFFQISQKLCKAAPLGAQNHWSEGCVIGNRGINSSPHITLKRENETWTAYGSSIPLPRKQAWANLTTAIVNNFETINIDVNVQRVHEN